MSLIRLLMEKQMVFLNDRQSKNAFKIPKYSLLEEILNSTTHALGMVFSIFAFLVFLLRFKGFGAVDFASLLIYAFTLFVLYTISTLYHAMKKPKVKSVFRKLDHSSIFLLIAGTYTPICTIYIKCVWSKAILALVWIFAILGIFLNMIDVNRFSKISLALYVLMGWSIAFISKPAFKFLSRVQIKWLVIGGIFYTVGAAVYVLGKKVKYMHSVWHLFVLVGSVFHFMVLI